MPKKFKSEYVLLTGRSNEDLAKSVAACLGKSITCPVSNFSDGEIRVKGNPNLRRLSVFIIQSTCPPVNDNLIELILMIDAARRASAAEIIAIIPYFGYARQDRKEQARVPISASVIANIIADAGADRILTLDVHSPQSQGFITKPWDNLFGSYALIPKLKRDRLENCVIVSPDAGGFSNAAKYAKLLNVRDVAVVHKQRSVSLNNRSKIHSMIGNVRDKNVLIVDDMIDSGGTLVNSAEFLKECGANLISVVATHGVFSGNCLQAIASSPIDKVLVTDTVGHRDEVLRHPKIAVVSVAALIARAVTNIFSGDSLSEQLILK